MTFANHTRAEKRSLRRTCRHCGARRGEWCIRARRPKAALLPAHFVAFPVIDPSVRVFQNVVVIPKAIRTFERAEYLHRCRGAE